MRVKKKQYQVSKVNGKIVERLQLRGEENNYFLCYYLITDNVIYVKYVRAHKYIAIRPRVLNEALLNYINSDYAKGNYYISYLTTRISMSKYFSLEKIIFRLPPLNGRVTGIHGRADERVHINRMNCK